MLILIGDKKTQRIFDHMNRKKYYLTLIILVGFLINKIGLAVDHVDPYRRPPIYKKGSPEWVKQKEENAQRYAEIEKILRKNENESSIEDLPVVYVQQTKNGNLTPAYYRRFAKTIYLWNNLSLTRDQIPYRKNSIRPLPILKLYQETNQFKIEKVQPKFYHMKDSDGGYHITMYDRERGIFYTTGESKGSIDGKTPLNSDEVSSICYLESIGAPSPKDSDAVDPKETTSN